MTYVVVLVVGAVVVVVLAVTLRARWEQALYQYEPVNDRDGVEKYRVRTEIGQAEVTKFFHPYKGDSFRVVGHFPGGDQTAEMAPHLPVVDRWLRDTVADHQIAAAVCGGRDPAFPGQRCPLPPGHPDGCFGAEDAL